MSLIGDDSTQARQLHRARLIAGVSHPNLVRLVPRSGGGYSTALAGAQRLSHFSSPSAPFRHFELEHAVRLLLDVLNGLGALHDLVIDEQPFVHGCVSPENICVDAHGQARLLPLARWQSSAEAPNEMNGYAAPEWLLGSQVDRRTDLFSVGVLLWEALAGRRLFPEPSPAVVLARLASGALPRPALPAGADWAWALCLVADRALSAEPASRPATAQELSSAIVAAGGPRLTRPLAAGWHDEAPTLPPQPRPQPPRRSFTPPGVAIDLSPEVKPEQTPLLVQHRLPPVPVLPPRVATLAPWSAPAPPPPPSASPPRAPSRRASFRPWLFGATAATYLALIGWLQAERGAPPVSVQPAATPLAGAPAPSLNSFAVSATGPVAATDAATAPLIRAAPSVSASPPATMRSAVPATSSAPRSLRSVPAPRRPAPAKPHPADYGI